MPRAEPSQPDEIRVYLVEDDHRTREGLGVLIGGTPGFEVIGASRSMEEAIPRIEADPPHIMLADIGLPGMSGIEGVRRLKTSLPLLQILMLTVYTDNVHVFEAICAGASGYLLKDTPPQRLLESLRELHGGGAPMSPEIARKVVATFQKVAPPSHADQLSARELEVLKLLTDGHSYKTAANALSVSIDTVRFHIRSIYAKLHVHSKSEAVTAALRHGIIR